jgi:hypothetical protein
MVIAQNPIPCKTEKILTVMGCAHPLAYVREKTDAWSTQAGKLMPEWTSLMQNEAMVKW